ncbi:MAG: hypothetical protein AABY22_25165 [Nanoarchaeota archaeon]
MKTMTIMLECGNNPHEAIRIVNTLSHLHLIEGQVKIKIISDIYSSIMNAGIGIDAPPFYMWDIVYRRKNLLL